MRLTRLIGRTGRSFSGGIAAGVAAGLGAAVLGWLMLAPGRELSGRVSVIDGDSLRVGEDEVRLAGIDAPELRQTCRLPRETIACGREARQALADLVTTGTVACRSSETDRFGRALALCQVDGRDINREMVLSGQAVAFGRYEREERAARDAGRGIWASQFERPAEWRARHSREN